MRLLERAVTVAVSTTAAARSRFLRQRAFTTVTIISPAGSGVATEPRAVEADRKRRSSRLVIGLLALCGPGLVVMLADTDAGSLITAAQSGTRWGYEMVLPQLVLIPILYIVQEMTVRLGILTGKGHGALIREHFGRGWGLVSAGMLFRAAGGAPHRVRRRRRRG